MNTVATKNKDGAVWIVLAHVRPHLLEYRWDVERLREVSAPLMGFRWGRSLICAAGADKFNDVIAIIRSPDLPIEEIDKLRNSSYGHF